MNTTTTQAAIEIKTIDINAKEWFDRVNGNSYFAAIVTVNFGMENEKSILLPFQYGYGNHYVDMAGRALINAGLIPDTKDVLWRYCDENKIILRKSKQENCLKRDLKAMAE